VPAVRWLAYAAFVGLVLRIAYILCVPDFDGDAYAHYEFASRVVHHPGDLTLHWIWLPGFHFFVAGLQILGAGIRGVRITNALLQTVGPILLYRFARHRESQSVALTAALLWSVSSLANLLATTALAETLFTLLMLSACGLIDAGRRPILAGLALAAACSLRYEAWFATAIFGIWSALKNPRSPPLSAVIPSACVVVYIVIRRWVDGEWLWFIRETYRFTHMQRGLETGSRLFDVLWLPVIAPLMLLGPAIVLLPKGLVRTPSTPIIAGLTLFVALTYLGHGTLGHTRYLTVLMPFAFVFIARGCDRLAARYVVPVILSVLVTSVAYVGHVARGALADANDLRAREVRADSFRH
jgi:hypothetical protein